ncbi:hypothetical protein GWK47_044400 [Chionoecetes opilio]|uniref:WAP domain-containing protein n=1 Tax=Chionoecetes opilio TaxID=41210 RepID=A0A8J4Y7B0_CHIOP|nr:hypothetical protein GWK47_044400 [Chionoecetes opilio]
MVSLQAVAVVVLVACVAPAYLQNAPASCSYWCRTPEGQSYCCKDVHDPVPAEQSRPTVKGGRCPVVRDVCPPTRFFGPPTTCAHDGDCGYTDKCCFDRCLGHHTCKPPLYGGHGGVGGHGQGGIHGGHGGNIYGR